MRKTPFTMNYPPEMLQELTVLKDETGVPVSEFIRRAVRVALDAHYEARDAGQRSVPLADR